MFDWKNTALKNIQKLADEKNDPIDSEVFTRTWRAEMFKAHAQARRGNLPWINTDEMHLQALKNMSAGYPLLAKIDNASLVESTWSNLRPFTGAPEAINRLRTKYTVSVLTVLSWRNIVLSSKRARVQRDGILSCEF